MVDNIYSARVDALREMMLAKGWDAVVFTGSDPHSSEYPAERWKQVQWLSGFTGEAGDLVITADHAGLWTDTRYFIQANAQLAGTGIELHKTRVPDQVLIPEWLAGHFSSEMIVAVDGLCISADFAKDLIDAAEATGNSCLVTSVPNILDSFWKDRPSVPQTPVFLVDPGEDRQEKLSWLRTKIQSCGADFMLITALDEIAWLLNVRASDIEFNPLVISYLLVGADVCDWFVLRDAPVDEQTEVSFAALEADGIRLRSYDEVDFVMSGLEGTVAVDVSTLNYHLYQSIQAELKEIDSPVPLRKAIKNPTEIAGMKAAHFRDGIAMERFLYWLEQSVQAQRCPTERDASIKLGEIRSELDAYQGDSFETISAYGKGAALPHYVTPVNDAPVIYAQGLYLCDSGGQYLDGTTDITRTIPLGPCSTLEKEDYTLVLKGHIDLAMAIWPKGTTGCHLDALAREPLWRYKRNFGHGTGHGIGWFLGVHEGPQEFRQNFNKVPLLPGMILTDEPGIYREGRHGIRHENVLLVVEDGTNDFGSWLRFETLTLCHFDTSIIMKELLNKEEIEWLNAYNASVWKAYKDKLPRAISEWLREKTAAI